MLSSVKSWRMYAIVDVRLLTRWNGRYDAETMIAKPNFHSCSVFSENLVAIEMRKLEVKFDEIIYVIPSTYPKHVCINFITSTCYRCIEKCKVMYIDMDSLIYYIEYEDVYEIIKHDINRFNTSDYAVDNAYGIPLINKKVSGLMKDENNGVIMTESSGLEQRCTSYVNG